MKFVQRRSTLTIAGEQAVNGVQAVAVRVSHELHPQAMLYFDKETGLPVKSQMKLPSSQDNPELVEVFFEEYKELSGVRHFTRVKIRTGELLMHCELRDLTLLTRFDPDAFKKPAAE